jgi:manganese/zinc/iron transport system substrate-binding protein
VHDAFAYFARHFEFEVRGLQGISPELDAGVYDVSNMVSYLIDNDIQAVFVEESLPTKTMEAVVKGCAAKGHDVSIGEPLLADNVGVAGSEEGTYLGMVKYNVNALVLGLAK